MTAATLFAAAGAALVMGLVLSVRHFQGRLEIGAQGGTTIVFPLPREMLNAWSSGS